MKNDKLKNDIQDIFGKLSKFCVENCTKPYSDIIFFEFEILFKTYVDVYNVISKQIQGPELFELLKEAAYKPLENEATKEKSLIWFDKMTLLYFNKKKNEAQSNLKKENDIKNLN